MLDWVEGLKSKLSELRILSPKENVYTKLPDKQNVSLLPTRDPTSPLPPPPAVPPEALPGIERSNSEVSSNRQRENVTYQRRRSESQSSAVSRRSNNINEPQSAGASSNQVFNFDPFNCVLEATGSSSSNNVHYEHLFQPGKVFF